MPARFQGDLWSSAGKREDGNERAQKRCMKARVKKEKLNCDNEKLAFLHARAVTFLCSLRACVMQKMQKRREKMGRAFIPFFSTLFSVWTSRFNDPFESQHKCIFLFLSLQSNTIPLGFNRAISYTVEEDFSLSRTTINLREREFGNQRVNGRIMLRIP